MTPLHIQTPLLESSRFSLTPGRTVLLKMESMQPSGSFKIRGIGLACQQHAMKGTERFISSSGGNGGLAVAYAGRQLKIPVTVVVPETTSERARALLYQENAEVIVQGASWQEANTLAQSLVKERYAFLHPFDDAVVWHGHATIIDEIAATGIKPEAVVVSVGGGGLFCGVIQGLLRNGWSDVKVVTAETVGADSLAQSLKAGQRVELAGITSIATSLGAREVCQGAFQRAIQHAVKPAVVSDKSAVQAALNFLDDHRVLVEPACGASLALLYDNAPELDSFRTIVVIVCGGATATVAQLQKWSEQLRNC